MNGEPIAGTWRLWAFDGQAGQTGQIENVELRITPQAITDITIVNPTGIGAIPSTQPFVRVEVATNGVLDTGNAMFRVTNGPALEFYDAGPMTRIPDTGIYVANVPVKQGINDIMVRFRATSGTVRTEGRADRRRRVSLHARRRRDRHVLRPRRDGRQPNDALAGIRMDFLQEGAAPTSIDVPIAIARSINSVSTISCRPRRCRPWCNRWRACRSRSSAR